MVREPTRRLEAGMPQGNASAGAATAEPEGKPLPTFPVHCLPEVLRTFVTAQAAFTEVPVDLPAMLSLGACAAMVAGKVDIEVKPGYIEPLNAFFLIGLKTGERKTPNYEACFGPVKEAERLKAEADGPLIARDNAIRGALDKRLGKLQNERAALTPYDVKLERASNSCKRGGVEIDNEIADVTKELDEKP